MHGSRGALAAGMTIAAIAVAACGGDDEGSDDASAASGSGSGKASKKVSVVLEQTLTGVAFAQQTKQGAEAAAKELGPVDLTIQGPPSIDPVLAQKQTTDALAKRPDAVGVTPFPPEVWQRTMKTIADGYDTSLAFNVPPASDPAKVGASPLKTFIGVNDKQAAGAAAARVIELAKLGPETTGTALVGQCVAGNSGVLHQRAQGFAEVVKSKLPEVEVKIFDSKVDPNGNTDTWQQQLKATPEPALAWGTCDQDGTSLYKLKKRSGAKFPVAAMETPPETLQGLKDGTILVSSTVPWYLEGYVTTRILVDAARGKAAVPKGFVDVGTTLVTKENVDEIQARNASASAAAAYYKPVIEKFFSDLGANVKPLESAFE